MAGGGKDRKPGESASAGVSPGLKKKRIECLDMTDELGWCCDSAKQTKIINICLE